MQERHRGRSLRARLRAVLLHEANGTFVFVEQWADEEALKTHSTAPAIGALFGAVGEHLDGAPDIKMLTPVVAGDPAKGQLRG